jgi:outer membrane protein assembly factor BamB
LVIKNEFTLYMSFDFSANFVYTGTSQTWIKPAGLTTAYFYVNGAGGAGNTSSASGGGGAYSLSIYNFLQADVSYNVTVNVGGGGQAPPIQSGGISAGSYLDPSGNSQSNGGYGTTLTGLSSGGGGGMTSLFYIDPSNNEIIKIIAGGGGGGGMTNSTTGGASGNIGTLVNNNSAVSSIGSAGSGTGGGQGGNSTLVGNAGVGGINGGVNGHDFIDSSGAYFYFGGGGGSGGTFAGGGGGAGYGGAAGGKEGGGGGGGSFSNGNTILFSVGAGGAGGAPGQNGGNGSVSILWNNQPLFVPDAQVKMYMLNAQHTAKSIYTAPSRTPQTVIDISFSTTGYQNPNAAVVGADGEIYIVGGDGALYAYTHSFALKWTQPFSIADYPFFGTPAITANGTLYVSTTSSLNQKYFYAVSDNGSFGGQKWAYAMDQHDGDISTSPILDVSNNILFGTVKGIIYALIDGGASGINGWQYPSNGIGQSLPDGSAITGVPAVDTINRKLCYTSYNPATSTTDLTVLDLSNNSLFNRAIPTLRWSKTRSDGVFISPSINNSAIYVSSTNGYVYAYDISNNGNSLWTAPINIADTNLSAVAIGDGNRLYLTSQNALNVIDSSNGALQWTYPIDSSGATVPNNSIPIIDASNNIFFGARNSYLYSVNGEQRMFNWRYKVGGAIQGMPVISADNHIYVGANNARLYDFSGNSAVTPPITAIVPMYMLNVKHTNLSTYYGPTSATIPAIYWQAPFVSGNLFVSPSIAIDSSANMYLGSNDGYLYSLNSSTGATNWLKRVNNTNSIAFISPNSIYTTPVIGPNGTIYIGSNEGYLFALTTAGTIKWSYHAGYPLQSSPIMDASGSIYFGAGNNMYAVGDAGIEAYSKWLTPFSTNAHVNSSPALGPNGLLYFGSDDGYVYAINSFTGLFVWSYNASTTLPAGVHPIYTSASVDASMNVIIGNGSYMNGSLYYLDGLTGALIWQKNDFLGNYNGPFYNTVTPYGDTIYLSTIAYVFAINRLTGVTNWYYYNTNCYYTSVAIDASGTLYFGSIKAKTVNQYTAKAGVLHCLTDNGTSWTENWALQVCNPGRLAPPVIGPNQTIYISATANNIYAIK